MIPKRPGAAPRVGISINVLSAETGPGTVSLIQPTLQTGFQCVAGAAATTTEDRFERARVMLRVTQNRPRADPEVRAMSKAVREPYIVRSVVHASQILGVFESPGEVLRLRDVVQRTGFGKGLCFRLLHTLHHCGLLEKVDASRYRLISEMRRRKRHRLGYAGQGQDTSFAREVHASLQRAAEPEDVELIAVNNRYQPKVALRNAEHLVREGVDLVLEFQTDESVAPAIASKYL